MKKFFAKHWVFIVVATVLVVFAVLTMLFSDQSKEMKEWIDATKNKEYIVNVVAQTTCKYCLKYKPVMEKVHDEYDFNLNWVDIDTLSFSDKNTFTHTYDLTDYKGTPYTFITYDGEVVDYLSGSKEEDVLVQFLKDNNVIG